VYTGTIDWQEFVAATIHMGKLENEDAVRFQLTAKRSAPTVLPQLWTLLHSPSCCTMLPLQVARAFKHFDRDNSGTITDDEVAVVLKVCG
jgi:Ca2+-binding EF-hand superfamily protein